MIRAAILALTCALCLAGCADTSAQNDACAQQVHDNLRWGYYPGYGCGPVPPAQTKFS
jgi:ABC-type uncharacterized transport system auxiliary subunit